MPSTERDIGEVAGRQQNVITRAQLLALGVSARIIERRLEVGRWQRLHNGVYLIGPAPPTLSARARAAALACGDGAAVSHCTAAELWEMLTADGTRELHVTVLARNPGTRNGIPTHRVRQLPEEDVTVRHGIPLTSPARTICDLAATEPLRDVESALTEARIHRLATASNPGRSSKEPPPAPVPRSSAACSKPRTTPATPDQRQSGSCAT